MKRPSLADEDNLTRLARRVLIDFVADTLWRGQAGGKIVFTAGDGEWAIPLDFDALLAAGRDLLRAEGQEQALIRKSLGPSFALLGLNLAQTEREGPDSLAIARRDWEDTLLSVLRARGPQAVVIVEHFLALPTRIARLPIKPPVVVAVGLNATQIVAYVATCRVGEPQDVSFDQPVALNTSVAHAFGVQRYLKIFGPGKS